jgi:glycerate kinase
MTTVAYGGTAGGAAAGLYGLLNATLVNGIDYFLDITDFDIALSVATWVITGEGSIDEQTLQGKGPFGVASRAKKTGLPVIGLAGRIPLEPSAGLKKYFDTLLAIGNEPANLEDALKTTAANLARTAEAIGHLLSQTFAQVSPLISAGFGT